MHPAIAALYTSQGERPRAERAVVYDLTYAVEMATGVAWKEFPTRTGGIGAKHPVTGRKVYGKEAARVLNQKGGAAEKKAPTPRKPAVRKPAAAKKPSAAAEKKRLLANMQGRKDGLYKIQGGAGETVIHVKDGVPKILTAKQVAALAKKATPKKPAAKPVEKKPATPRKPAAKKPAPKEKPAKKPAQSDPLAGHPLAGKTRVEMVQSLLKDGSVGAASNNPRGYDKMPEGIDANKFRADVLGSIKGGVLGGRTRLHQLYRQIKDRHPGLTVEKFQRALGAMHLDGDVILGAHTHALERRDGQDGPLLISDEEMPFLMPMDKQMYRYLEPGDERSKRLGKERRERQAWQEEQARRGQEKAQQG